MRTTPAPPALGRRPSERFRCRGHALLAAVLLGTLLTVVGNPVASATDGSEDADGRMELVLDASGSMKEPHGDGRTRFRAAVDALREVVGALPGGMQVGLRIYGSKIDDGPGSCQDSELVVPVGPLDKGALRNALGKARPLGNTPIAYSLREAAKDLPSEGSRTIVLVSDGEESCGGDPCQVARDLSKQGLDLHVDVVGFQVDAKARNQLTCIAQAGRGTFYDAPNADALVSQLSRLSARAARAYAPRGTPVEGTDDAGGAPLLEPGQYLDTIGDGGETETYLVDPAEGSTLHVSATDRPTSSSLSDSEQVEILVTTPDGQVCDQQQASSLGAFDRLTPVTAAVTVDGERLADCGDAPYAVSVHRTDGSGVQPLEVTVLEEPAAEDVESLPPAAEPGEYDVRGDQAGGKPEPVYGSPSFTSAPVLEPGTYRDSILVAETLFYGVELDWGQQLVCDVRFGRSAPVHQALGTRNPTAIVQSYGPLRNGFFDPSQLENDRQLFNASRPVTVHFATPPVRYQNRTGQLGVQPASLPGTYYCSAFLNGDSDYASAGEVPIELSVSVVGTAGEGAPTYVEAEPSQSASPSATPAEDPAADDASQPADGSGGFPLWVWLVGLLVILGAVLAWLLRRSPRRSR
ncbi:MAG: vWA domain-containing protein [Nocardioides sp.]